MDSIDAAIGHVSKRDKSNLSGVTIILSYAIPGVFFFVRACVCMLSTIFALPGTTCEVISGAWPFDSRATTKEISRSIT